MADKETGAQASKTEGTTDEFSVVRQRTFTTKVEAKLNPFTSQVAHGADAYLRFL